MPAPGPGSTPCPALCLVRCSAGDEQGIDKYQEVWRDTAERLYLLLRNPEAFIKRYGGWYGF